MELREASHFYHSDSNNPEYKSWLPLSSRTVGRSALHFKRNRPHFYVKELCWFSLDWFVDKSIFFPQDLILVIVQVFGLLPNYSHNHVRAHADVNHQYQPTHFGVFHAKKKKMRFPHFMLVFIRCYNLKHTKLLQDVCWTVFWTHMKSEQSWTLSQHG